MEACISQIKNSHSFQVPIENTDHKRSPKKYQRVSNIEHISFYNTIILDINNNRVPKTHIFENENNLINIHGSEKK